jgi:hypothetical protein
VVHSAPAYGLEDFQSCKAHGMKDDDILKPVMGDGRFASTLPLFGGLTIWEASKPICEALRGAGALFELKMFDHSYMHCWRHKTPIVYRATSQWFAGMDITPKDGGATLREGRGSDAAAVEEDERGVGAETAKGNGGSAGGGGIDAVFAEAVGAGLGDFFEERVETAGAGLFDLSGRDDAEIDAASGFAGAEVGAGHGERFELHGFGGGCRSGLGLRERG